MNYSKWMIRHIGEQLYNKTVALTGSTGGIGTELCMHLAYCGANLILVDRNEKKQDELIEHIHRFYPECKINKVQVDLEDMESVKKATEKLKIFSFDYFLHNAGAYRIERHKTSFGYDNSFQINFISPYYMILQLKDYFQKRGEGHILIVGSIAHRYSKIRVDDVDFHKEKKPSLVYGNAKRYLMMSCNELFKEDSVVKYTCVHPGITYTNMTLHYPNWIFWLIKNPMKVIFMKPKKAALSILYGFVTPAGDMEWVGPRYFDVWGLPKKKKLHSVRVDERKTIAKRASSIVQLI